MSPELSAGGAIHAGCVAVARADGASSGVLIRGPSGAGKSGFALRLIALGARLVSDDRTELRREGDAVLAAAPAPLHGLIEARGVGLMRLPALASAPVALVVDLAGPAERGRGDSPAGNSPLRLPERRFVELFGLRIPLVLGSNCGGFAAAVLLLAQGGALVDPDAPIGRE